MTHKHVETVLGRLATDAALRRRFLDDPVAVLGQLREAGLELTRTESDALAATDADAIQAFARALDQRLRKTTVGQTAER